MLRRQPSINPRIVTEALSNPVAVVPALSAWVEIERRREVTDSLESALTFPEGPVVNG